MSANLHHLPLDLIGEVTDSLGVYNWHTLKQVNTSFALYIEGRIEKLLEEKQGPHHFSLCVIHRHTLVPTWQEIASLVEAKQEQQIREVVNRWTSSKPKEEDYTKLFTRVWTKNTPRGASILFDQLLFHLKGNSHLISKIVGACYKQNEECVIVGLDRPYGDTTIWEGVRVTPENVMGFLLTQLCLNSGFQTGDITGVLRQVDYEARDVAIVIIANIRKNYGQENDPIEPKQEIQSLVERMQYANCKAYVKECMSWL